MHSENRLQWTVCGNIDWKKQWIYYPIKKQKNKINRCKRLGTFREHGSEPLSDRISVYQCRFIQALHHFKPLPYTICAHTHVHIQVCKQQTITVSLPPKCLWKYWISCREEKCSCSASSYTIHIIRSIIENNNKHCGTRSTHKSLLVEQAFRWVKKLSEEQKHHYPSAWVSTKYFSNDSGGAAEILFNQEPL